ncbi:phage tail assembly chaperone [Monoglobus pectinilyticus]|jgi:hypothetical protein|uniref:phage tail assembly chaperone n=1 Tax=Monoglobus pectinilyticus TaxID=1981510 RepID=UPI000D793D61|nr:MAG: hypothetical protein DBY15_02185 [Clostridiales bacterium]DAR70966.1 MAG TPA: tail assembly chaperone protein [Caudoviricetes sp.]
MSNKNEKITIEKILERKETLLKKEKKTAEVYIKSLDGTVKIMEPSFGIVADITDMEADMANKYIVYECLVEPSPKSPEIQEAFGNPTISSDVLDYMFKPGELSQLAVKCTDLAGFEKSSVEVVKN